MSIIILDPGKYTLKGIKLNDNYELQDVLMLKSKTEKVQAFTGSDDSAMAGQFQVEIPTPGLGKFIVGEGVENFNSETTKVNTHFKVCILTGIGLLADSNEPVEVVIGCPSSDYANEIISENYKNMIKIGKQSIVVNDEVKIINIQKVNVFAEGMMIRTRMICKQKFPSKNIINCIDIGGYNTNLRQYDKAGNILKSTSLNNAGINSLEVKIRDDLRKIIDLSLYNVDAIDINQAIRLGYIAELDYSSKEIANSNTTVKRTYSSSKDFLQFEIENFIENQILNKLKMREIDVQARGNLNVFSGGGSLIFKQYMSDQFKSNLPNLYFADDPQFENIASYISRLLLLKVKAKDLSPDIAMAKLSRLLSNNFGDLITVGWIDVSNDNQLFDCIQNPQQMDGITVITQATESEDLNNDKPKRDTNR